LILFFALYVAVHNSKKRSRPGGGIAEKVKDGLILVFISMGPVKLAAGFNCFQDTRFLKDNGVFKRISVVFIR
jgi:hypothetical protein